MQLTLPVDAAQAVGIQMIRTSGEALAHSRI
jgi:hypothetical protein